MNKLLEYILRSRDETEKGANSARSTVQRVSRSILGNLANIKAGWDMLGKVVTQFARVFRAAWTSVLEAMKWESMRASWRFLIGNIQEAQRHMEMLRELGDTPPFSLDAFNAASRALQTFGGAALNTRRVLEMVGDSAHATGQSVESVAQMIGRAYASLRDGQPLERVAMQMRNTGLVAPGVIEQLKRMQDAGASASDMWGVLTAALGTHEGAMQSALDTGEGLIGQVRSRWTDAVRDFGGAFLDLAKNELAYLSSRLKALRDDGVIVAWAERAKRAVQPLVEMVGNLFDEESRGASIAAAWEYLRSVFDYGADMLKAAGDYVANKLQAALQRAVGQHYNADLYEQSASVGFHAASMSASARLRRNQQSAADRIGQLAEERRARAQQDDFVGPPLPPGFRTAEEKADDARLRREMDEKDAARRLKADERAAEAGRIEAMKARRAEIVRDQVEIGRQLEHWIERNHALGEAPGMTLRDRDARLAARDGAKAQQREEQRAQDELRRAREAQARGITISARRQELIAMEEERVKEKKEAEDMEARTRNMREALHLEKERIDAEMQNLTRDMARDLDTIARAMPEAIEVGD